MIIQSFSIKSLKGIKFRSLLKKLSNFLNYEEVKDKIILAITKSESSNKKKI